MSTPTATPVRRSRRKTPPRPVDPKLVFEPDPAARPGDELDALADFLLALVERDGAGERAASE
jgi:hypothetical protein